MHFGTSMCTVLFAFALLFGADAFSHGGKKHGLETDPKAESPSAFAIYKEINGTYQSNVKPILESKCLDCHGNTTRYPWYYQIPGAKQLIDYDLREAKEHLDMSQGFPFKGHGSPAEDLQAIRKSIEEGTMPPFRYRMLHWDSKLDKSESDTVFQWIAQSESLLKSGQQSTKK